MPLLLQKVVGLSTGRANRDQTSGVESGRRIQLVHCNAGKEGDRDLSSWAFDATLRGVKKPDMWLYVEGTC